MRLTVTLTCFILAALILGMNAGTNTGGRFPQKFYKKPLSAIKVCPKIVAGVKFYRERTWTLEKSMGRNLSPTREHEKTTRSCRYAKWVAELWRHRARATFQKFQNPPHKAQWLCIHSYEGAWNDPNSPYYGGLQMDIGFQQAYGLTLYREKGTADNWTPMEQMWVAERAFRTRGFWPWPNTARYCGLL